MKIIHEKYSQLTGKSEVIIKDKGMLFMGISKVLEEDEIIACEKTGLTIAHLKAVIKAKKRRVSVTKQIIKALKGLTKSYEDALFNQEINFLNAKRDLERFTSNKETFKKLFKRVELKE